MGSHCFFSQEMRKAKTSGWFKVQSDQREPCLKETYFSLPEMAHTNQYSFWTARSHLMQVFITRYFISPAWSSALCFLWLAVLPRPQSAQLSTYESLHAGSHPTGPVPFLNENSLPPNSSLKAAAVHVWKISADRPSCKNHSVSTIPAWQPVWTLWPTWAGPLGPVGTARSGSSGRLFHECLLSSPRKAWTIVFCGTFPNPFPDPGISKQLTCFVWETHLNKLMKPLLWMNAFRLLTEKFWKGNIISDKNRSIWAIWYPESWGRRQNIMTEFYL